MEKLNQDLLKLVKQGFVPMPGGQAEPVAGASPMTAALSSGGMGAPPGGDPMAGGMPPGGDPMAGGMPPGGDPAMMGGDPNAGGGAPPIDPAMLAALMGGGGGAPAPTPEAAPASGSITLTIDQLIQLITALTSKGSKSKAAAPAETAPATGTSASATSAPAGDPTTQKLDEILNHLKVMSGKA